MGELLHMPHDTEPKLLCEKAKVGLLEINPMMGLARIDPAARHIIGKRNLAI